MKKINHLQTIVSLFAIVFGHQASIEMQEMALTVKFGGKLIFLYLV